MHKRLQPELAFVRFIQNDTKLCDEFAPRSGAARAAVIGRDAGARSNELPGDCIGGDVVREAFDQIDDVEGKSLGASTQFIRGKLYVLQILKSLDPQILKSLDPQILKFRSRDLVS